MLPHSSPGGLPASLSHFAGLIQANMMFGHDSPVAHLEDEIICKIWEDFGGDLCLAVGQVKNNKNARLLMPIYSYPVLKVQAYLSLSLDSAV